MVKSSIKVGNWIIFILLAIVLFTLPLQACAPKPPAEPDIVKVSVLPYTSHAPLIIAMEEGFFADENLAVEFVRLTDGSQAIPMLIQGDLDATASGIQISMLNAIADGQVKIVADRGYMASDGCTYAAFLAPPSWIDQFNASPVDALTGARISLSPVGFEGLMIEKVLGEYGLSLDDMVVSEIAPPNLLEAVENDSVDIMKEGEPWVTRLLDSGLVTEWYPFQELVPDMQFGVIMFGPNFLVERPEVGIRFMKAYLKGVEQYNEGKTERNIEILAEFTELDVDLLQRSCWPPIHTDGMITTATIDEYQQWAFSKGLIEQVLPVEDYWDPSFVEAASR
jgi:NitT/TauT family transport system substrate-binding protein